jgi:iron uptake system component EfeO
LAALCAGVAAVATVAALGGVSGCSSGSAKPVHSATTVSVSVSACGQGWRGGAAGPVSFVLHNTDYRSGEVDLIGARTGAVYAEVEPLAPGATADLRASLSAGQYAFRCSMEDEPSITGATVTLTGRAKGQTPGVVPVSQADLIPATKAYATYVTGKLPALLAAATRLRADIAAGDLAAARRDWLPAHLDYQRLGAAYDAFGDADAAINGLADGLPHGVADPTWRGFHRIEYGLWHGQPATVLRPLAADLVIAVQDLIKNFATAQIDPLDIGVRAHEITEDIVRFVLTGRDDYGSHTSLATIDADLAGTEVVLGIVTPLLTSRYPGLAAARTQLAATAAFVVGLRDRSGNWPPLSTRPQATREQLDARISQLAEQLAPIAAILEPRRTS